MPITYPTKSAKPGSAGVLPAVRRASRLSSCILTLFILISLASPQAPPDPTAPILAALCARDLAGALQLLQPALEQFAKDPRLWSLQGVALSGEGHKRKALAAFQHALSLAPNFMQALEGAAQIEYEASSDAAIPHLQRILTRKPRDPTAHAMLAVLEYQRGHCNPAVVHFEKAGTLLDSQIDALHAYSTCLMKLKKFDEAAIVFQRSLTLRPDDPQERRLLGIRSAY
jgi:Flp pilus assembly protein TadD